MPFGSIQQAKRFRGYRRKTKNAYTRRAIKRYQRFTKQSNNIGRSMIGFPKNQLVKMRYSNYATMDLTVPLNGFDEKYLRANSIFAPEVTPNANAHQPLGHDQWASFYERYVVIGSKIKITATMNNTNTNNYMIGLYLSDAVTTFAVDPHALIEQGKSVYSLISPANNGLVINKTLQLGYSAKKWHGITDIKDVDTLEATFGANPQDQTYFVIFCGPSNLSAPVAPTATCMVQYVIDYLVMVKDPLELQQS